LTIFRLNYHFFEFGIPPIQNQQPKNPLRGRTKKGGRKTSCRLKEEESGNGLLVKGFRL
jgi:hypothetical protein